MYNLFNNLKWVKIDIDNVGVVEPKRNSDVYTHEDVKFIYSHSENTAKTSLFATKSLISHVYLAFAIPHSKDVRVFGDSFERGYGDLMYREVKDSIRMFWYMFLKDDKENLLKCLGVRVQSNVVVSFKVDNLEILVDINTQSGGTGVNLDGRTLEITPLEYREYNLENIFESSREFLKVLMGDVEIRTMEQPAYGFNNWYYAYGDSSHEKILKDTRLLMELCKDIPNKPYMVIDDGWLVNPTSGPCISNEKFPDMGKLASEIEDMGAIPGIWFRPLKYTGSEFDDVRHPLNETWLDPTCEKVIKNIKDDISKFVNWGYKMIKFDFVTVDIYTRYGWEMPDGELCPQGFKFQDNHYTNAEIIVNMYKEIKESAKDAILIGCNAIGHLCAGIVQINRIGDDTSGFEWERTRKYGVNSLAYRLIQHNIFYAIDADCVGIMGKIDWKQNREWLNCLAASGSPLFVSFDPDKAEEEIKKDVKAAFEINSVNSHSETYPIDIETLLPKRWSVHSKEVIFDWDMID